MTIFKSICYWYGNIYIDYMPVKCKELWVAGEIYLGTRNILHMQFVFKIVVSDFNNFSLVNRIWKPLMILFFFPLNLEEKSLKAHYRLWLGLLLSWISSKLKENQAKDLIITVFLETWETVKTPYTPKLFGKESYSSSAVFNYYENTNRITFIPILLRIFILY